MSAFVLLTAVVLIASLQGDQGSEDDYEDAQNRETVQEGPIDDYVWLAQSGFMRLEMSNAEMIHGLVAHENLIYYLYVEYLANPITQEQAECTESWESFSIAIQVKGIDQAGIVMDSVTIPEEQGDFHVVGFDIKNANEISIIKQIFDWENGQGTLYYSKHDFNGNLLLREALLQTGTEWTAQEAHFKKDGAIAVIGLNSRFEGEALFWDDSLSLIREKPIISNVLAFTGDGSYVYLINESAPALRETDLITGEPVQELPIPHPDTMGIHLAEENSSYDFYVVTAHHLYGYYLDTGEIEPILNFLESHINISTPYHIAFTADGHIAISQERVDLNMHSWFVELALLSPVQRDVLADRDYIVLAGFMMSPLFVDDVMRFNRSSPDMQIVLHDYWDIEDGRGFSQAIERFHFDIIAGNVPDIILFKYTDDADLARAREALVRQGVLTDLYLFIDADPELSREDFFQNVLEGLEDSGGALPMIGNWLTLITMIALDPPQIENWTLDDFLALMEQSVNAGNLEPLGGEITGTRFLTTVLEYMGKDFVDTEAGISHFESAQFIRLLELAANIPANQAYNDWPINFFPEFSALLNGDQAVDLVGFAGYYGLSDIRGMSGEMPPPFTYIGLPGASSGFHSVRISRTFSIFANSQHQDAAWQFIREFLMPGATENIALTLRIDDFENRVAGSTMTAQEKNTMQELMNQAVVLRPLSDTIIMVIEEEFSGFYHGLRTAEEAARVIQNRVQTYLHERS